MKKIYLSLLLILSISGLKAQNWTALGVGVGSSTNQVFAVAYDNTGNIYAGGDFPGYLRKWNGSSWSAVGSGDPNGPVRSIAVRSASDIYVGGDFTNIGGTAAKYVARIGSGGTITALGNGFNNRVRVVYCNSFSGSVYAGGDFTVDGGAGTTTYNHVAKLSGSSFIPLGSGVNSNVYSMVEHIPVSNGGWVLYAGTDNFSAPISKYEGGTWGTMSGISGGYVYALASYYGYLYAGGDFTTPTYAAARYSFYSSPTWGTTLTNFAPSSVIRSMFVRTVGNNTLLYIGGDYTNITSNLVSYIGYINSPNTTLKKVNSGGTNINGAVWAISNQSGKAIVGGKFTAPGSNVAITDVTIGIDDVNDNIISSEFFPNPMTDRASIQLETKTPLSDPVLEIYDLQSRLVNGINSSAIIEGNKTQFIIDRSGLTSGTYFYMVKDKDAIVASNRFIVN